MAAILSRHRHLPHRLTGPARRVEHLLGKALMVGKHARYVLAQCHDDGAGERGQIHDGINAILHRQSQSVSQHQSTLGIGVEHLEGLTVAAAQHVAGFDGRRSGHVLREHAVTNDAHRRGQASNDGEQRQGGGGSSHVHLHGHHAVT